MRAALVALVAAGADGWIGVVIVTGIPGDATASHDGEIGGLIVGARTAAAIRRKRRHDEPAVDLIQVRVVERPCGHAARCFALQHDVGLRHQLAEHVAPGLGVQVKRDGALAGVVAPEMQTAVRMRFIVHERRMAARGMPAAWFDQDDLGAGVAEQLAGVGAGRAA